MYCAVLGPYNIGYTSNGRYMLVGGQKGHLAMMDMLHMDLIKEFEVSSFTIEVFPSTWVYFTYPCLCQVLILHFFEIILF